MPIRKALSQRAQSDKVHKEEIREKRKKIKGKRRTKVLIEKSKILNSSL
jgi:hypothetical protein